MYLFKDGLKESWQDPWDEKIKCKYCGKDAYLFLTVANNGFDCEGGVETFGELCINAVND